MLISYKVPEISVPSPLMNSMIAGNNYFSPSIQHQSMHDSIISGLLCLSSYDMDYLLVDCMMLVVLEFDFARHQSTL